MHWRYCRALTNPLWNLLQEILWLEVGRPFKGRKAGKQTSQDSSTSKEMLDIHARPSASYAPCTARARKGQHHNDVLASNRVDDHLREVASCCYEFEGESERLAIIALRLSTLAVVILIQLHGEHG